MLPPHMRIFGLLINNVLRKQKFPFTLSLIYQVIPYVYHCLIPFEIIFPINLCLIIFIFSHTLTIQDFTQYLTSLT